MLHRNLRGIGLNIWDQLINILNFVSWKIIKYFHVSHFKAIMHQERFLCPFVSLSLCTFVRVCVFDGVWHYRLENVDTTTAVRKVNGGGMCGLTVTRQAKSDACFLCGRHIEQSSRRCIDRQWQSTMCHGYTWQVKWAAEARTPTLPMPVLF